MKNKPLNDFTLALTFFFFIIIIIYTLCGHQMIVINHILLLHKLHPSCKTAQNNNYLK